MTADVRRFVRNCEICAQTKVWRDKKHGLLKPLPIPSRPWAELSVDFVTGLPRSAGAETIMVVTDRLSKWVTFEPMIETTAAAVAEALLRCTIRHHGNSRSIVSDRGPQFVSTFWKAIYDGLGVQRRLSTAFHPQTDGATERANQEMEAYLRAFVTYEQTDWSDKLPAAMVAINNRVSSSTGMFAFYMTHGYRVDWTAATIQGPLEQASPAALGRLWISRWQEANRYAQAAMGLAQERQAAGADRKRQPAEALRVGDRVVLRLKHVNTGRPSKKLDWLALP